MIKDYNIIMFYREKVYFGFIKSCFLDQVMNREHTNARGIVKRRYLASRFTKIKFWHSSEWLIMVKMYLDSIKCFVY